jgi:hypothetical protein
LAWCKTKGCPRAAHRHARSVEPKYSIRWPSPGALFV